MGDAKRRKQAVGDIGRAARYYAWLRYKYSDGSDAFARIPFFIKADGRAWEGNYEAIHKTNLRAVGNFGLILACLRYPDNPYFREAISDPEALGESGQMVWEWSEANNLPEDFLMELRGRFINIDNQISGTPGEYPKMKGFKEGVGLGPGEFVMNVDVMKEFATGTNGKSEKAAGGEESREGRSGSELDALARDILATAKSSMPGKVPGILRGSGNGSNRAGGDRKSRQNSSDVRPGTAILLKT